MKNAIRTGILTLAGSVGVGLLAFPALTASAASPTTQADLALNKRDDLSISWFVADDGDDDDTRSRSRTDGPSHDNTNSRSRDATNSRFTAVSRDRDRSRGDLTRDWTRDGGDRTKDRSRNHTGRGDGTRNDTRRNWR